MAVASTSSNNVFCDARRPLPIVFVPGTMGTRLATEKDGTLVWNPLGWGAQIGENSPGIVAPVEALHAWPLGAGLLGDLNLRLKPIGLWGDGTDLPGGVWGYPSGLLQYALQVRHFFSAIPESYSALLLELAGGPTGKDLKADLEPLGYEPKVYVAGYDWRLSCVDAATRFVDPVVNEALEDCPGAQKVILVAHSMGGVISRYYCKAVGGEKVHALFLLASPVLGAMKAYSWLKKGFVSDDGDMLPLRAFMLNKVSNWASIRFNRSLPSMYEMLYSPVYTANVDPMWLTFDLADNQTGWPYSTLQPWGRAPQTAPDQPTPGRSIDPETQKPRVQFNNAIDGFELAVDPFTGVGDDLDTRDKSAKLLRDAEVFVGSLVVDGKAFIPDNTFIVASSGKPTKARGHLHRYGDIEVRGTDYDYRETWRIPFTDIALQFEIPLDVHMDSGDGTVPAASALPRADLLSTSYVDKLELSGVDHGEVPNDVQAQSWVRERIVELVEAMPK